MSNLGLIVQSQLEQAIGSGKAFAFHADDQALANGGNLDVILETGDCELHLQSIVVSADSGPDSIKLFEGVTASADGTILTTNCKNRVNKQTAETVVRQNPTISNTGTEIDDHKNYTASKKANVFDAGSTDEWILSTNTKYLVRFNNASGGEVEVQLHFVFYEVPV